MSIYWGVNKKLVLINYYRHIDQVIYEWRRAYTSSAQICSGLNFTAQIGIFFFKNLRGFGFKVIQPSVITKLCLRITVSYFYSSSISLLVLHFSYLNLCSINDKRIIYSILQCLEQDYISASILKS